jgi:hypothetical protein
LLILGSVALFLFPRDDFRARHAVYFDAVCRLKNLAYSDGWTKDGAWVGDVTELYRLGVISKEVAEADIAPIRPLVAKPRPFHGYHVVAMESAPDPRNWNEETVSLKGRLHSQENFAFCIYPVAGGTKRPWVYIVTSMGIFGREATSDQPLLKWPTGKWRQEWSIMD